MTLAINLVRRQADWITSAIDSNRRCSDVVRLTSVKLSGVIVVRISFPFVIWVANVVGLMEFLFAQLEEQN